MIKLDQIEVTFGDFVALKNINIHVKEGEFFTFLGPSGCGKTTTLRTITGFIKPSSGKVSVRGVDITDTPIEKRNIGMVFQSYALFPTMSVYENIAFGLKVQKMRKEDIRQKVYAMAEKVDLNEAQLQKKVSQLSGGQQQRVAIARALVTSPEIICLDEPLSNLDAKLRVQLRNELKDLQKRFGITTVYVTHDQEEALTLSDRIAVFNKGVIEQIGHPDEIYNHSATEFVCNFIGDINRFEPEFLEKIGVTQKISYHPEEKKPFLHPGRQAEIFYKKIKIGYIGEVHPEVADQYEIGERVYLAVLDMPEILPIATFDRKYNGIAKYPSVTRDISMVMPKNILVGQIEEIIETKGGQYLESYALFDIYEGSQIMTGYKSVAYSITFRAGDRTLEEKDVNEAMERILKALKGIGIELRQ